MAKDTNEWITSIAEVEGDEVIIKGYKLSDLVGNVTFCDMIFLIFSGELPKPEKRNLLEAIFVTIIEHGISPTTIIARMLASCGTPLQASVAGATLSIADYHGGSCEQVAEILYNAVSQTEHLSRDEQVEQIKKKMVDIVAEYRLSKKRMEGFGHPQHTEGDPRANMLFNLAGKNKLDGIYTKALKILGEELTKSLNRPMPPNITGAIASLLLDLGFDRRSMRGFVIAPRSIGITAHIVEELEQGGRWRHVPKENVSYVGSRDRKFIKE